MFVELAERRLTQHCCTWLGQTGNLAQTMPTNAVIDELADIYIYMYIGTYVYIKSIRVYKVGSKINVFFA